MATLKSSLKIEDFRIFDKVILGDVHKHQTVYDIVTYVGSLLENDFGDDAPGYMTMDDKGEFQRIDSDKKVLIKKVNEKSVLRTMPKYCHLVGLIS